jgi:glycosyltransferase involved in cell wall biosynthesis
VKALLVSLFHPELVRGGAQQMCYELFLGLQARDEVEPVLLAAIDTSFRALFKSGARITGFDGRPGEFLYLCQSFDDWWLKTSDTFLRESFADFLALVQPDVVHFHHLFFLGVDLITLTRKTLPRAKIILTLHEFLAICNAQGHMVRTTDHSQCNRASSVRCHQCFPERAPEEFFMRELWIKRHLSSVDLFTTPSEFMIDSFVNWGLERGKFAHVANGQDIDVGKADLRTERISRNRFGFFGQLLDAKGVHVLLEAVDLLRHEGLEDFSVEINGDNLRYATPAYRAAIEASMARESALPPWERRVKFNGSYQAEQIGERMRRVDWCVVPSVWREAFCLVISEAKVFGRPVIASDLGAMAERVRHDVDGLLFSVADSRALAETMRRAATEEGLWERLSGAIVPPPSRAQMVEGFLDLYRG